MDFLRLCFLFVFLLVNTSQTLAQQPELPKEVRDWVGKNNATIEEGVLVQIDKVNVSIKTAGGVVKQVARRKLSKKDREYSDLVYAYQQDNIQFEDVKKQIDNYRDRPQAVLKALERIHQDNKGVPYAAMIIGVIYAAEKRNYVKAEKYFEKAQDAIEKGLGLDFHTKTAFAIRNNIAVVGLKTGDTNKGAGYLFRKTEGLKAIPFCNHHNATLALDVCEEPRHRVSLNRAKRKQLEEIVLIEPEENLGSPAPRFFLYSLDFDLPPTLGEVLKRAEGKPMEANGLDSLFPNIYWTNEWVPDDWCPYCEGTNRLECPNRRCKLGKVERKKTEHRYRDPNTGKKYYGMVPERVNCPTCNNKFGGKVECEWCNGGKVRE